MVFLLVLVFAAALVFALYRWLASGQNGYVLFDRDGGNASAMPTSFAPNFNVITSEGATGGIAASGASAIQYVRVDETGTEVVGPAGVALEVPVGLAVASADGYSMVVWAFNTRLSARVVDDAGILTPAFDAALGAYSTFVSLSAAGRGSEVGIAWTADPIAGVTTSWFQLTDADGPVGSTIALLDTGEAHTITRIAATDDGYAVLITGPPPTFRASLMTLDATGNPTSEAVELAGASFAHDLASLGDSIAVIAVRDSGEPEMRAYGLDLTPAASWVCLGPDVDPTYPSSISPDGAGYTTLHTTGSLAVMLHRLDALGTGAQ